MYSSADCISLISQLIFLLPEPSFDYLVISDPTSPEIVSDFEIYIYSNARYNYTHQVSNQKEKTNNMLEGSKAMMKDPNFVTDGSKEEMLALREEIAVLRKEFDQLFPTLMVRCEKVEEVREELDLLNGLKSEVETLAGKVKELEKYVQGGVKLGELGLEKSASDEVDTSLEANIGGSRSEKEKKVMEEVKAKSTRPLEGTKEVETKSEVNNNMEDGTAKSSTASKTNDDTVMVYKKVKKAGVDVPVLFEKRVEEVQAERSTTSTRPVDQKVEKTGVGASVETSVPAKKDPVVLDFVSVKPKIVKKRSK